MGTIQINVVGVMVNLRDKEELISIIDGMNEDRASTIKAGRTKTNKNKRIEKETLSFFGSISHYLKGGAE
jgi:hypothetical protein